MKNFKKSQVVSFLLMALFLAACGAKKTSVAPAGASGPEPGVTPDDGETPQVLNYARIRDEIFKPNHCLECHSTADDTENRLPDVQRPVVDHILLYTREDVLNNPDYRMVVPGNSAESELYISVSRTDRRRMPPVRTYPEGLTAEQQALLKEWIDEGALE